MQEIRSEQVESTTILNHYLIYLMVTGLNKSEKLNLKRLRICHQFQNFQLTLVKHDLEDNLQIREFWVRISWRIVMG
jgi:hypothetical protein